MKNFLLFPVLFFLIVSTQNIAAQVLFNPKISAVLPLSDYGSGIDKVATHFSYAIGMDVRIGNKAWRINPGIHYQPRRLSSIALAGDQANATSHTIQIPIHFAYYLTSRDSPINLSVRAGTTVIIPIGEVKFKDQATFLDIEPTAVFAASGGLSLDLAIFTVDLLYINDLQPFLEGFKTNNNALQFSLGYLF